MTKKSLFLGDSITEAFPFDELLPEFEIVNKGVWGDNTELVLSRLERDVLRSDAEQIFILIGTNDMASGFSDEKTFENYDAILLLISTSLPKTKIFVQSILPTRGLENRPLSRIDLLNGQIHLISRMYGAEYLDIGSLFVNSKGEMDERFSDDGLHLTRAGYSVWADYLRTIL